MKNINFLYNNKMAHRALHNDKIPENSLKAIRKALQKNIAIEMDVHILKDGTIVLFHDNNLKRMMGKDTKIKGACIDDLDKCYLLNTKEKICKLDDALKEIQGKVPIIIEIKDDKRIGIIEDKLIKIFDSYKGLFAIKSFNYKRIYYIKRRRPEFVLGLLVGRRKKYFSKFLLKIAISIIKPDFLSIRKQFVKRKVFQNFRKSMPILVWTIKGKKDEIKYRDYADSLIFENR